MKPSSDLDRLLSVPERITPGGAPLPPRETSTAKPNGKANAGRFELLNSFVDCQLAECTRGEMAVWLVLFRDTRNGRASTAQSWIAKRAGVDESTVWRAVNALKKRGLVEVLKRGGKSSGLSIYRVRCTPRKDCTDAR